MDSGQSGRSATHPGRGVKGRDARHHPCRRDRAGLAANHFYHRDLTAAGDEGRTGRERTPASCAAPPMSRSSWFSPNEYRIHKMYFTKVLEFPRTPEGADGVPRPSVCEELKFIPPSKLAVEKRLEDLPCAHRPGAGARSRQPAGGRRRIRLSRRRQRLREIDALEHDRRIGKTRHWNRDGGRAAGDSAGSRTPCDVPGIGAFFPGSTCSATCSSA